MLCNDVKTEQLTAIYNPLTALGSKLSFNGSHLHYLRHFKWKLLLSMHFLIMPFLNDRMLTEIKIPFT